MYCIGKIYLTHLILNFHDLHLLKACQGPNYGYGCNQSCQCVHGTCIASATNANESCTCSAGFQTPFCVQLIDTCGKNISVIGEFLDYKENLLFISGTNNPCNNVTEDCAANQNNASAICTCKAGYQRNSTSSTCTSMNNH
jgi:hypothetical protein